MAKLTQDNYKAIRDHLFDRIHRTGEQVKNDFPNILRSAIKTEAWKRFTDFNGKPFENLVDWMLCTFPNGTSLGQGQHALTYEEALKLTEGVPDVHQVLYRNAPKGKPGPKSKNGNELRLSTISIMPRGEGRSRSTTVLSARLAQETPKYYEAYLTGKYKSVTAAAIAAGLMKDDANMRRAKSAIRKMTAGERKELWQWAIREELMRKEPEGR